MSPWSDGDLLTPDNLNNKGAGSGSYISLTDEAYAGVFDGSTNNDSAVAAAVAAAIAAGKTLLWNADNAVITSAITDSAGKLMIQFVGSPVIRWNGAADTWIFDLTTQYSELLGHFLLGPHTVALNNTANGIRFSSSASRCTVRGFPTLNRMKNGIKFVTVYGNEVEIDITLCSTIGVDFDTEANRNTVRAKTIGGTSAVSSKGIRNDSENISISSQQLSEWATGFYGESYSSGTFSGFTENNTLTLELEDYAALYWDANGLPSKTVADEATLVTPFGHNHPSGTAHVPETMIPTRSLSVFYPFQDAGTTIAEDRSGNGRTGTKNGSWASTTGPTGQAITLATTSTIRVPITALTYNGAWTVAMLVRNVTWGASDTNLLFRVFEGSNTIAFSCVKDTYNVAVLRNGSSQGNLSVPMWHTNEWVWLCVGYDGSATAYHLHPASLTNEDNQSVACTNPLTTTIDTLEIGGSVGSIDVASFAIWNGRVLSRTEMLHWCNQVTPPTIPAAVVTIGGNETRGATSVADGGTVAHGLGTTPTLVTVTPSTASEMVSVTALGATTFTVAIKKHDNSAGTTQTVYWRAVK